MADWKNKNNALYKAFTFKDFRQAFDFMKAVAEVAEERQHHPRWQNDWNKVKIWLSTHSEGKATEKDQQLSKAIDVIYKDYNKAPAGTKLSEAKLYTDGGSRGNPGPSAGAFVICKTDDNVVEKSGFYIGITTNNQAEYQALLQGLKRSQAVGIRKLNVFIDSELIVKQLNGLYKIKNEGLKPLYRQIKDLATSFEEVSFTHVPRALNKDADAEVNRILDEKPDAI